MKLALLAGNRLSAWHMNVFARLGPDFSVTAFRAESEIQRHFDARGAGTLPFPVEPIYFDTQRGPWPLRKAREMRERYAGRTPEVLPFHDRMEGFDHILSWELFTGWTGEALTAQQLYRKPLHLMVWDNIPFNHEDTAAKRAIKRRALREATGFIVHTRRSREMLLLEGATPERIHLIPPGVDLQAFAPGPREREGFGLDSDDFVLLFVGWLLPRKGIEGGAGDRRVRLLIAGEGPGEERVHALVERLQLTEVCVWAGARPYASMPALFRAADVFVLPSIAEPAWQEQFAMSLIEAMACGVPALSTLSGAIPEIAGDAALLVQPNDFKALHDALERLARDPDLRRELAARGRERAGMHFSLDSYAAALRDYFLAQ
jgi:glycosyltransferase involved in cell wall biosynthesis